jgi:hypothetical protein
MQTPQIKLRWEETDTNFESETLKMRDHTDELWLKWEDEIQKDSKEQARTLQIGFIQLSVWASNSLYERSVEPSITKYVANFFFK